MIELKREIRGESPDSIEFLSNEELIEIFTNSTNTYESVDKFQTNQIIGNGFTYKDQFYNIIFCTRILSTPDKRIDEHLFFGIAK